MRGGRATKKAISPEFKIGEKVKVNNAGGAFLQRRYEDIVESIEKGSDGEIIYRICFSNGPRCRFSEGGLEGV